MKDRGIKGRENWKISNYDSGKCSQQE